MDKIRNLCYTHGNRQTNADDWRKDTDMMKKDELIQALRDRDNAKHKNAILWCLAVIGAITAIAAIAYAVYRYLTPDYLEDFDDDFDDDFNDFFDDEEDEEEEAASEEDSEEEKKEEEALAAEEEQTSEK